MYLSVRDADDAVDAIADRIEQLKETARADIDQAIKQGLKDQALAYKYGYYAGKERMLREIARDICKQNKIFGEFWPM